MHLVFLSARLPLTKSFVLREGIIASTPYPHVTQVTSHHEQFTTLTELHAHLVYHAANDHCLFNGQLTTPLLSESRAGKTAPGDREWVVFDFDKVEGKDAADVVQRYLPAECQHVSYVTQLSASMFRPDTTTWSGHIFMLLDKPVTEQYLKQWFEYLNFTQLQLERQLRLSDSLQALHWPLDRTVAYNSKLIYIAPPKCHGFTPAVKQHIVLTKKKQLALKIASFQPIDSMRVRSKINELRRGIGEADISYDVVNLKGADVLRESAICDIHGIKTSGDHYIRFNLNGGDSYAYYIDLRAPELIRNFKGEPFLKTEDAAPDLWKKLRKVAAAAVQKQPLEDNAEVLAFYDTLHNSAVRIGMYLPISRKLVLNSASEKSAAAWLAEYGLIQSGFLPHMNVVFDPTLDVQYVPGDTQINTFRATEYMMRPKTGKASKLNDLTPTISKLLRSVLGNPTEEILGHFLNWLAFIYQTRTKATTAWVFSGTEGTGKGAFVQFILRPVFGSENVRVIQYGLLKQEFNGFLENSLFVVYDEADMTTAQNSAELEAKLRHYITDSPIEIRKMRTDPYTAPNYTNHIFNSNKRTPVSIGGNDRRYNIAEYQPDKLFLTPNELLVLQNGSELEPFADLMANWPVDEVQVRTLIDTQTRRDVHEAATTINQLIADAIVEGDLQFFIDRTPSDIEIAADFHTRFNPIGLFRAKIDTYVEAASKGEAVVLKDEDVFALFRTLIPDARYFQDNKTWRTRHYKALGLDLNKKHRVPGSNTQARGLRVMWKMPENVPIKADETNVVPMKKGKKK